MKRCLFVLLCLALLALALTGCSFGNSSRGDIEKHLLDRYSMGHFRVSKDFVEVESYGDEPNRLWTVTLTEQPDVSFQVLEDRYDPHDPVFSDNYPDTMLVRLAESCDKLELLEVDEFDDYGLSCARLYGTYSSRAELEALFDEIFLFRDHVKASGYQEDYTMDVELQLDVPLRRLVDGDDLTQSYRFSDGDIHVTVTDSSEYDLEYALEKHIQTCTDYQFEELLREFEQNELDAAIANSWERIWIHTPHDEMQPYFAIEGATGNWLGISFGSLYKVLQQTGFEPIGTPQHYSFAGADGGLYEVSYDFYAYNPDTSWVENAFYYMKDGEQVWMTDPTEVHFDEELAEAMLGLDITLGSTTEYED